MTSSETAHNGLTPGSEHELEFTDLLATGQAVARADGLVVFCFGPLPGERARVRVRTRKASYAVAEMLALLRTAAERTEPFCPVFGECGGCQVQHLAYDAQLRWKREVVCSTLQRIGGLADVEVAETIGAQRQRSYRNKMALVVDRRANGPVVGFYRARSHEVVAIDACPVVEPALDAQIGALAGAAEGSALRTLLDESRHAVARAARGECVVAATTQGYSGTLAAAAEQVMQELPNAVGLVDSYAPKSANAVAGSRFAVLAGSGEVEEEIGGIRYRVSPASFFQVNVEIVARIFETLARECGGAQRAVDLYCGMGTFTLFLSKLGARTIGVEENVPAVQEARENAQRNGMSEQVAFAAMRVEQWVSSEFGRRELRRADVVFLDPPRKGSDERTLRAIIAAKAKRILYLSCDPATLARDLRILVTNGYALRGVQPFDMFPQTGHVEALATLQRAE
ncbi:MAG: 23S rRNA (uracil(1939)-C(5))-methyltransferase RlmD [Candidatus Tyrphobacter sp.]